MTNSDRPGAQQGIALIAVLWMLMLTGVIGATLMHLSRNQRGSASREASLLQARLLADAGIRRAILGLATPALGERWSVDGSPQTVTLFGQKIAVRLENEAGKIDIGTTSEDRMTALFHGLGVEAAEADLLANHIKEWQSPPAPYLDIEEEPYRQEGVRYGPAHRPFRSVEELRMVQGMTDELFQKVQPLVTIYSHLPNVDPFAAGDQVLKALDESGDAVAHGRRLQASYSPSAGNDRPPMAGLAVRIIAIASWQETKAERHAVIRLVGNPDIPYLVLSWD